MDYRIKKNEKGQNVAVRLTSEESIAIGKKNEELWAEFERTGDFSLLMGIEFRYGEQVINHFAI